MARLILAVAFFGLLALTNAAVDWSKAEWTGKPWLGKWESTDKQENWQAYIDALALPAYQGPYSKGTVKLWKAGDHYHHSISIPAKNVKSDLEFKFGEEVTVNRNGTEAKITYTEDGDKLVVDVNIPAKNKHMHDVIEVVGEELIKTYKSGDVTAKRWFKRVPHTTTAAPAS